MQDEFIIGGFLGIVTSVVFILLLDIPQDAQKYRQLAKPLNQRSHNE